MNESDEIRNEIKKITRKSFKKHSFFSGSVRRPDLLVVNVKRESIFGKNTGMDHSSFPKDRSVVLTLNDMDIYDEPTSTNEKQSKFHDIPSGTGTLSKKLHKVITHEFGHLIDARFNAEFGWDDSFYREQDHIQDHIKEFFRCLWNSFIDGRLSFYELNPFSLEQRISDASKRFGINSSFVEEAWDKKFWTYREILSKAHEAYNGRKTVKYGSFPEVTDRGFEGLRKECLGE